jgi:hypothetical protein
MRRVTLFLAAGISWSATPPVADVPQIVQSSARKIAEDWNQAPQYSFVERDVESKHDSPPLVKSYEVLMIDSSPYNRLIGEDDKPLPAGEKAEEQRKLEREIRRRQHESEEQRSKRLGKYLKERHQDIALLKGMVDAFAFQLVGAETVDGRDCWVLDANPKPGYQPMSRETKVLTGMRGRLWIDKASGQWAKVRAEVFQTVSFYGFFAKVHPGTSFLLEQEPVAENLWLPKHFKTQVSASVLGLFNQDSVEDETYSNYRPMSQALSQLGAN